MRVFLSLLICAALVSVGLGDSQARVSLVSKKDGQTLRAEINKISRAAGSQQEKLRQARAMALEEGDMERVGAIDNRLLKVERDRDSAAFQMIRSFEEKSLQDGGEYVALVRVLQKDGLVVWLSEFAGDPQIVNEVHVKVDLEDFLYRGQETGPLEVAGL